MRHGKTILLTVFILLAASTASGAIVFNSSEAVNLNISQTQEYSFNQTGLNLQGNNINNFFGSACSGDQVVTDIKDDGSLVCGSVSGSASGLSEVLEANNTANQTINFGDAGIGVSIGDSNTDVPGDQGVAVGAGASTVGGSTAVGGGSSAGGLSTAVGQSSTASGDQASALGSGASATAKKTVAFGEGTKSSGDYAISIGANANGRPQATKQGSIAFGSSSSSTAGNSISIGYISEASAQGAVAIGPYAVANNNYETTFGALNENFRQDINVTGNATIHGSGGLDMPNGVVIGGEEPSKSSSEDVVIGKNADGEGTDYAGDATINTVVGSNASGTGAYSSSFGTGSEASGSFSTALGDNSKASGGFSTALGWESDAIGDFSVAIGGSGNAPDTAPDATSDYSIALGSSSASADGAVAIGRDAVSDQEYTARFGSDFRPYDVDVTGDLQVDGSLTGVSTGGAPENLSETLAAGNVANQSIDYDGAVALGNSIDYGNLQSSAISIGQNAGPKIGGRSGISIGASSDSGNGVALGNSAKAESLEAVALGNSAEVRGNGPTGQYSVALGSSSSTNAEGAVALGYNANSPNSYEATLGNLQGQELDLNVTGNATIHGSGGLNMPNGVNIGGSSTVSATDTSVSIGPSADAQDIGSVSVGDSATSALDAVAIGGDTEATSDNAVAIGALADATRSGSVGIGYIARAEGDSSVAIGDGAESSADGAVAIGANSVADEQYTVEFGSSSQAYDVNVTGDLNVDGMISSSNSDSISYSTGHTAWSSSLSGEEVHRIGTLNGEAVIVDRVSVQMKGGGSNSDLRVDVLDESGSNSITVIGGQVTASSTQFSTGEPVRVEITNSGSREAVATISLSGRVVDTSQVTTGLQ